MNINDQGVGRLINTATITTKAINLVRNTKKIPENIVTQESAIITITRARRKINDQRKVLR